MATVERSSFGNHEVANQPPPLVDYNVFEADRPLVEAVAPRGRRVGARADRRGRRVRRQRAGAGAGPARQRERAEAADPRPLRQPGRRRRVPPRLARAAGRSAVGYELHCSPWKDPRPGAHVARGAAFMCMSQAEAGIGCPISMTYSVIPALRTQPELAAEWEPRFLSAQLRPAQRAGAARRPAPWPGWG